MADIILINDQDQEQTLTGVDKLTTRSADGNKTFVFDPSGGAAVGYGAADGGGRAGPAGQRGSGGPAGAGSPPHGPDRAGGRRKPAGV